MKRNDGSTQSLLDLEGGQGSRPPASATNKCLSTDAKLAITFATALASLGLSAACCIMMYCKH